jgi:hypothetical protein
VTRFQEIRQQVSALSVNEKAELAAELLANLSPILGDEDENIFEAHRRDREMERDPKASITWEQLRRSIPRGEGAPPTSDVV